MTPLSNQFLFEGGKPITSLLLCPEEKQVYHKKILLDMTFKSNIPESQWKDNFLRLTYFEFGPVFSPEPGWAALNVRE